MKMLAQELAPTDVGKHSDIIKAAQDDLTIMDVLVCGRCLQVFHFIEEYQDHKDQPCIKESKGIRDTLDTKPSIWAFLLWKATQIQTKPDGVNASSWSLYQTWTKLEESVRDTWIVAGKTIQSFGKLGQGELQEMPVRITKTVVNNQNSSNSGDATQNPRKHLVHNTKSQIANIKEEDKADSTKSNSPIPSSTIQNKNRIAKRSVLNSNEQMEDIVEKIVAKRFNPRRKTHEYLVKWEGRIHSQNTWEPASHLQDVPYYLDIFERQLARQKQTKSAPLGNKVAQANSIDKNNLRKLPVGNNPDSSTASISGAASPGRPPRTSKTKAMDQVKQWVSESANAGSNSPNSMNEDDIAEHDWPRSNNNSTVGGIKRKLNDADLNDPTLNDSTVDSALEDLEEDLIPSHTVKRLKNGSTVSVEVKSRNEKNVEKVIKVNGTDGTGIGAVAGESLPVPPKSADVIITQDSSASGVVRKPGISNVKLKTEKSEASIRVLTKAETLVSQTGIVRVGNEEVATPIINPSPTKSSIATQQQRVQQLRTVSGGRQTPTMPQRQTVTQTRTPGGTIIQRRTISPATSGVKSNLNATQRTQQVTNARTTMQTSSGGRVVVPRQNTGSAINTQSAGRVMSAANKSVTPEEKIFNLSKSGDLKVTKKVMTREELRLAQQQRLQQQRNPQSQVQIQKVQQIAPPRGRVAGGTTNTRQVTSVQHQQQQLQAAEDEEHHAQLCPITGKLIGNEESQLQMEQEQQQEQAQEQQQQLQQQQQQMNLEQTLLTTDQLMTNEDGSPLLVRGEDGTVYQVAGKNAEGQTILVTQGPDGEQQFAYVAAAEGDDNQMLTLDNAVAEAVAQLPIEQQAEALAAAAAGEGQFLVSMTDEQLAQHQAALQAQQQQEDENSVNQTTTLSIQTGDGDGETNIPAEVVQADLPSPGGTRRVVLLLNDGTFMMTEMHDDEFKALNLAP